MTDKIAFIDDEYSVLESIKMIFNNDTAYSLYLFQNPLDALAEINKEEFAVIVSDLNMPAMKGTELLKLAKERWPLTECLVITAVPFAEDLKNTVFPVITKPWNVEDLKSQIQRAIARYKKKGHES